jgi:hypothetical protein
VGQRDGSGNMGSRLLCASLVSREFALDWSVYVSVWRLVELEPRDAMNRKTLFLEGTGTSWYINCCLQSFHHLVVRVNIVIVARVDQVSSSMTVEIRGRTRYNVCLIPQRKNKENKSVAETGDFKAMTSVGRPRSS